MGYRWMVGVVLVSGLAGCVQPAVQDSPKLPLLGGAIIAAAPDGYCLAPETLRQSQDGAVVLMGRCPGAGGSAPAVVTLSVGAAGSADAARVGDGALVGYFISNDGRAALSRQGRAQDVQVLEAKRSRGAFLLQVSDAAVGEYWRAITGLRGRLVTVSASGPQGRALPPARGRALVEAAVAALRQANPPPGATPQATP